MAEGFGGTLFRLDQKALDAGPNGDNFIPVSGGRELLTLPIGTTAGPADHISRRNAMDRGPALALRSSSASGSPE